MRKGFVGRRAAVTSNSASWSSLTAGERGLAPVPPPLWEQMALPYLREPTQFAQLLLHFLRGGRLVIEDALRVVTQATALLTQEANMLVVEQPVTVVGDMQGQLYDLAKILVLGSPLGARRLLFLGNYYGSGGYNTECLLLLLAAKVLWPHHILLLRGCNESAFMASAFHLDHECALKYSDALHDALLLAFHAMPLAALVDGRYFCVHGGLSPFVSRLADVDAIQRFREIPAKGPLCDLLWSDPYWDCDNPETNTSPEGAMSALATPTPPTASSAHRYYTPNSGLYEMKPTFLRNTQRDCSYVFNYACIKYFVTVNKLLCVVRSHEEQDDGYKLYRPMPNNNFPCMIAVFSAPNYCDTFGNKGAVVELTDTAFNVKQFFCSPRPYVMYEHNALTWSLPFLADRTYAIVAQLTGVKEHDEAAFSSGGGEDEEAGGASV